LLNKKNLTLKNKQLFTITEIMRTKIFFSAAILILFASVLSAQDSTAVQTEPFGDFIDGNTGVDMVFVKGGTFTMGCTAEQGRDCSDNEKPARSVTLGDFYIGRYEVTQKQWTAIMGSNPSLRQGDDLPVENVHWDSVAVFIKKLNALAMAGSDYWEYRLPTEAEWEYAARGGAVSSGRVYSGGGWHDGNSGGKTNPVGSKNPNELGIYDMSGNVWELVGDWYGDYPKISQTDPSGPQWGNYRVMRGGGWSSGVKACRVSQRMKISQNFGGGDVGFRLAIGPKKKIAALPPLSQLALLKPTYVKTRRSETVSAPVVRAPVADTAPAREFRPKTRSLRSANKMDKGISAGIGAVYSGDYGGGIAWANREYVAMPYNGGGAYMFVDAVYAETFAGYSGGGGKWESRYARSPNDLPQMSRSNFNVGVLLKYPVAMGADASAGSVFPLVGIDYAAAMSGKLIYANGNVYEFYKETWRYDANALSALWLKFGCGFNMNINLIQSAYLRAEILYGFRTSNALEKQDANLSESAEPKIGRGLTCRVGVGVKLL
jgi:formylglycine-generating enzyme required for sulfatase activity